MTRLIVTLLCKEPTLFFMGTIRYIVELSNYFLSSNNYNYISTYMRMPLVVFTINAEIHFASYRPSTDCYKFSILKSFISVF